MRSFDNLKDLYAYVQKSTLDSFKNRVAKIVKETLEKYVQQEVYDYPQGNYQRTMDLLHGIEVFDVVQTGNNTYSIDIGWGWDAYLSHTTIYGGSTFNYEPGDRIPVALVAYALEHGYTWNRGDTNFMGMTLEELLNTKKHIEALKNELKKKGIEVK